MPTVPCSACAAHVSRSGSVDLCSEASGVCFESCLEVGQGGRPRVARRPEQWSLGTSFRNGCAELGFDRPAPPPPIRALFPSKSERGALISEGDFEWPFLRVPPLGHPLIDLTKGLSKRNPHRFPTQIDGPRPTDLNSSARIPTFATRSTWTQTSPRARPLATQSHSRLRMCWDR